MQVTADDRSAFAPPPQPGMVRAFTLAVVAHLLLVAALTSGLQWKRDSTELSAEAELWSAVPQQAAPKPTPEPPAPPAPPPPVVRAPPLPDPQVQRDAQIALERERAKEKREQAEREEARRDAAERRQAERERKAEAERKLAAERKREEEADRREQVKLAAEARRKEEAAKKKREEQKREEQETQRVAKLREENLNRMRGLAGGTGGASSTGSAAVSSGPSASWAGRVRGRVRPNIVFSDDVAGNPTAEVEVRMAPDGTIVGKRLTKPSGNRSWDEAVLRAIDKTETLPRDTDGRVPASAVLVFRPKD